MKYEYPDKTFEPYDILRIVENKTRRKGISVATFKLEIMETLSRIVDVEAESYEEACEKLRNDYRHQRIVLDENDFVEYEIFPY